MTNSLKLILPIAVIALLIGGVVFQENKLSSKQQSVAILQDSIELIKLDAVAIQTDKDRLAKENTRLLRDNKSLVDSVQSLNKRILRLNLVIRNQGKTILANREEIAQLQAESEALRNRIAAMRLDDNADKGVIAKLEDDRFKLDQELGELFMKNDTLENKVVESTIQKESTTQDLEQQKNIINILQNTKVKFGGTYTKKSNKNRAKSPKYWKYTLINLTLEHPDKDLLLNEKFMVQIIDTDSEKVLPPREATAGNTDTQGMSFNFTGEAIPTIKYSNYQKKTGKNYALKVVFLKNNKKYPIGSYKRITFKEKE